MPASLDSIVAATRQTVSRSRRNCDLRALEQAAARHTPRGFRQRLHTMAQDGIAVIAELKKASPSKGLIRADFIPSELAPELERAGAAALSVLTDEQFFQGSLEFLQQASSSTSIPCLRKDFIIDDFQILEARANQADAILLIVAALDQRELVALAASARAQELDVLCEAHDELELERALDAGFDLIGINSRNLRTFEVDLNTAFRLAEKMPHKCLPVAESGIESGADLVKLRSSGYKAFLIGESLMKAANPGETLKKLIEETKLAISTS
jgi:indole-3-glycerol phosphate synthase